MKEYLENRIKVIEYSFEDWEEGKISGNWEPGKTLIEDSKTREKYYSFLPDEEFKRIESKRKFIYETDVLKQFNNFKTSFERKYNGSADKERLLRSEITNFETLFFSEKLELRSLNNFDRPIPDFRFTTIDIDIIRKLYKKIIVSGEREYHFVSCKNQQFRTGYEGEKHILVEAASKYLDWLREFQELKILCKEELFNKIIAGLGAVTIIAGDSQILNQIDPTELDSYLSTYYRLADKVKESKSIGTAITNLRALVLYYKEQARRPKVTDISRRDETGKINFGSVARDTKIDDWINIKIVVPVEDKIKRLEELKDVYVNDILGTKSPIGAIDQPAKGFEVYLRENVKSLFPYLMQTYWNAKPQVIAFMLLALSKMNCIQSGALTRNKKQLHLSLTETFGYIGTRQALNRNLKNLQTADQYQRDQIKIHKNEISKALTNP